MDIGLNKEELERLSSFGKTAEEQSNNLYGPKTKDWTDTLIHMITAMQDKNIELILANNKKIAEQLKVAGVKLPE